MRGGALEGAQEPKKWSLGGFKGPLPHFRSDWGSKTRLGYLRILGHFSGLSPSRTLGNTFHIGCTSAPEEVELNEGNTLIGHSSVYWAHDRSLNLLQPRYILGDSSNFMDLIQAHGRQAAEVCPHLPLPSAAWGHLPPGKVKTRFHIKLKLRFICQ